MQEAAAAAFRRGSRADGQKRSLCKALKLQAFPKIYAMAGAGRKCITDAWGVAKIDSARSQMDTRAPHTFVGRNRRRCKGLEPSRRLSETTGPRHLSAFRIAFRRQR